MTEEGEIEKLLGASDPELYARIGGAVSGKQAFPLSRREMISRGRQWMGSKRQALAGVVCRNSVVKMFGRRELATHERVVLVASLAGLIVREVIGVEPIVVAALLVREGIDQLCHREWTAEEPER